MLEVYERTSGILILGGTIISSVNHKPRQTAITTVNVPFFISTSTFFLLFTPSCMVFSNTPTEFTTNCSAYRNQPCVGNFFSIDYVPPVRRNIDIVRKLALPVLNAMETDTQCPKPNYIKQ